MKQGQRILTEWAARQELVRSRIEFAPCRLATSEEEAVKAAVAMGFPVVIKVHASTIVHKTEANGVHLDIRDANGVREACRAIREAASRRSAAASVEGFLVQPFIKEGVDFFLGAARDASFGPYLLLGLGGVWVEVLDDVVAVALPATRDDVLRALDLLRAAPLLHGARGQAGVDRLALAEAALGLGAFVLGSANVHEVDINPLRVFPERCGAVALDARLVLREEKLQQQTVPDRAALEALLNPRGVVVVGVSKDASKFGSRLVNSIVAHGFERPLWAIHPRDDRVQGIPAFPSATASPFPADLAFITVEGAQAARMVREVAKVGVRAAVVFASGFAESGPAGEAAQAELVCVAEEAGVCLLGPNTPGLVSEPAKLYGSFIGTMSMKALAGGDTALLTQSGSVGSALLGRGWDRGLAFRAWVPTGDEAGFCIEHLLDYLAEDTGTRVIAIFVEMIRDGRRFRAAAQRARRAGKKIVVYAVGRSEVGRVAIQSHTGSLGGNQRLYDGVFRQDGIARVFDLDEMLDAIQALAWCPLPAGRRVAVVASSGASCGIAADDCEANGLLLPPLSQACKERLSAILPAFASTNNPLDVTAEVVTRPELIATALTAIADSGAYDAFLVTLGTQQGPTALQVARAIVEFQRRSGRPVIVSRLGADSLNAELLDFYRAEKLPVFSSPTRAARALRHLVQQGESIPC